MSTSTTTTRHSLFMMLVDDALSILQYHYRTMTTLRTQMCHSQKDGPNCIDGLC
ncbi:hypothetical protein L210DRAFT_953251, partial [Boletus edulis BED1]